MPPDTADRRQQFGAAGGAQAPRDLIAMGTSRSTGAHTPVEGESPREPYALRGRMSKAKRRPGTTALGRTQRIIAASRVRLPTPNFFEGPMQAHFHRRNGDPTALRDFLIRQVPSDRPLGRGHAEVLRSGDQPAIALRGSVDGLWLPVVFLG
jgi:hypothetical protein